MTVSRWQDGALVPREDCDVVPARTLVADSWLVADGTALALELHRRRFLDAVAAAGADAVDRTVGTEEAAACWDAAIASVPRTGAWFPRIELRDARGRRELLVRLRPAPELRRSIVLRTFRGPDPRTAPRIKGPDLAAMTRLRTEAQAAGADEAVLLAPDGSVAEGSTTAIAWWRGDALCVPADDIARVDSVTLRSVLAIAAALGVDVLHEHAAPEELDGLEIWALNALHGIRIVTGWIDPSGATRTGMDTPSTARSGTDAPGTAPAPAEQPGRLAAWRDRLGALRRPLP